MHRDAGLYSLPLIFNDVDEASYVRSRMDDDLRRALEDAGWVNFGFTFSGFAHLMSNEPVRSLKDLEKLRIWVPEDDRIGFDASDKPGPGTPLVTETSTESQDIGTVLSAQQNPDGNYEALAVIQVNDAENSRLILGDIKGPDVTVLDLPYAFDDQGKTKN